MNPDILGKGFAFPLQVDSRGGVAGSQQDQKIRESIRVILGTEQGERLMRPTFGANLKRLLFAPNTRATADLARYYVEEALRTWEPRILLDEVLVENDHRAGCLQIRVGYRITSTYEPQNMVLPFYLEQR
jgi:uncharacterized protein